MLFFLPLCFKGLSLSCFIHWCVLVSSNLSNFQSAVLNLAMPTHVNYRKKVNKKQKKSRKWHFSKFFISTSHIIALLLIPQMHVPYTVTPFQEEIYRQCRIEPIKEQFTHNLYNFLCAFYTIVFILTSVLVIYSQWGELYVY